MFEREICNKDLVDLYDITMNKLTSGVITGYKNKTGYIVIDHCIYYPAYCVAKIVLRSPNTIQSERKIQV